MEDLPAELTIDILSRLPVKAIIHCKRVCKKWRNLVLNSSFVNLHLSRSPIGLIVHQNVKFLSDGSMDPGILKWVKIEDKVDDHHLHLDSPMSLHLNMVPVFQNSPISLKGSVNGLICLHQYSSKISTYICNPVTREIMIIPDPLYYERDFVISACGFGVCSLTGEYKVVQTLKTRIPLIGNESGEYKFVSEAEVYTLGTGQWRSLGRVSYWLDGSYPTAVLNDHCHWIVSDYEDASESICTFDLNKETFQLFPSPPSEAVEESDNLFQSLAVLKGCLCKSDCNDSQFTIWVMKEYGIKKSWYKEVVIPKESLYCSREWPYWYTITLIQGLKDGTIFFVKGSLWAYYPRSDTIEEIDMFECSKRGLGYRPSFLKLQNFESERVHMF